MKVSLKWLSDYVKLPPTRPAGLAQRLTLAGLEVEGIESPGAALDGVVVGQILESTQHPNADKLSVTKIEPTGPTATSFSMDALSMQTSFARAPVPAGNALCCVRSPPCNSAIDTSSSPAPPAASDPPWPDASTRRAHGSS